MNTPPSPQPRVTAASAHRTIRLPSRRHAATVIFSALLLLMLLIWTSTFQIIKRERHESMAAVQSRLDAVNYAIYMQIENSIALIGLFMDNAVPGEAVNPAGTPLPITQALWVDARTGTVSAALHPPGSNDRAIARLAAASASPTPRFEALPIPAPRGESYGQETIRLIRVKPKQPGTLQVVMIDHQRLIASLEPLLQHITAMRIYAGEDELLGVQISSTPLTDTAPSSGALTASHGPGSHGLKVQSTYPIDAALELHGKHSSVHLLTALLANLLLIAIALLALRLTEYLRQYGLQLEMGRMHAEQASQIKTRFISQISHELRTPLHGIIGYADLIRQESAEPAQRESAEAILQSGEHLLSLVNRLLDAAKIETGQKPEAGENALTLLPIDLVPVVKQIVHGHEPTARSKSLATYVNAPTSLMVIADRVALGRILHNLLSNALKFTLRGGIRVEVKRLPGTARVEVIDTGIGIAREDQTRLFGMFVQGSSFDLSRFGGTGLGLYLTKQLVEGMGGMIGFHSALNAGTTFWFELPLAGADLAWSTAMEPA